MFGYPKNRLSKHSLPQLFRIIDALLYLQNKRSLHSKQGHSVAWQTARNWVKKFIKRMGFSGKSHWPRDSHTQEELQHLSHVGRILYCSLSSFPLCHTIWTTQCYSLFHTKIIPVSTTSFFLSSGKLSCSLKPNTRIRVGPNVTGPNTTGCTVLLTLFSTDKTTTWACWKCLIVTETRYQSVWKSFSVRTLLNAGVLPQPAKTQQDASVEGSWWRLLQLIEALDDDGWDRLYFLQLTRRWWFDRLGLCTSYLYPFPWQVYI